MKQVRAHCMPPVHGPPVHSMRIVLIEEMVFSFVIDQPVRIVIPVLGRSEMIPGAVFFIIQLFIMILSCYLLRRYHTGEKQHKRDNPLAYRFRTIVRSALFIHDKYLKGWKSLTDHFLNFPRFIDRTSSAPLRDECPHSVRDFKGLPRWLPSNISRKKAC